MTAFSEWLNRKYLNWQVEQDKRKTVTDFADYIGISQPLMSNYINGTFFPKAKNIELLADKLGSEVYEVLGLKKPIDDPRLRRLNETWETIAEAVKEHIMQLADSDPQQPARAVKERGDPKHGYKTRKTK